MNKDALKALLIKHEGLRLRIYKDTAGKSTIGVGRNLDDVGVNEQEATLMLENDINRVEIECRAAFPWFDPLDDVRQCVIANMVFNLGLERFKGFVRMIRAMELKDYTEAANQMKSSTWSAQVGNRAVELADLMVQGTILH